jgi:hypothetical protein
MVAFRTLQGSVFGFTRSKKISYFTMTGTTILICNAFYVSNIQRLMNQVATHTNFERLAVSMWFVTFHAVRDVTMFVMMAVCTIKSTVSAGVVFNLTYLSWMTGVTYCNVVLTENDVKGLVWILVTPKAVGYFKMRFASMTHGTLRNDLPFCCAGGMATHVTIKTTDF